MDDIVVIITSSQSHELASSLVSLFFNNSLKSSIITIDKLEKKEIVNKIESIYNPLVFIFLLDEATLKAKETLQIIWTNIEEIIDNQNIVLPVLIKPNEQNKSLIPYYLHSFELLKWEYTNDDNNPPDFEISPEENIYSRVKKIYSLKNQKREEFENTAIEYLKERLEELDKREKEFKRYGGWGLIIGAFTILVSIGISIWLALSFEGLLVDTSKINWVIITFHFIKGFSILGLLLVLARYSFLVSKFLMNESIKYSDRKHAITFGMLYLQIKEGKLELSEIKEVFDQWNIYRPSEFLNANYKDFNPDLIDKIVIKFTDSIAPHFENIGKSKEHKFS